MTQWLFDETPRVTSAEVEASFPAADIRLRSGSRSNLAVLLNDLVVHETKKLFGGAEVRLDAIVVHGPEAGSGEDGGFYEPATFRFSGVRDGDRLPVESPGLLVFYGRPRHFLDISVVMSRDRKDSADLGALIADRLNSSEWQQAAGTVLGLAVAAPPAAAILAGVGAAAVIGNVAAEILRQATGNSIGVYRTSYLQYLHRFGLGRHPEQDQYHHKGLSFWYEIVADRSPDRRSG
jgi:hypothetical protein